MPKALCEIIYAFWSLLNESQILNLWHSQSKLIDKPFGWQLGLGFWHLFGFLISFWYQLWNIFFWISNFWTNYRSGEKFFSVCVSIIYEALFTPLTSKSSDSLNLTYSEDCCKGEKIDFRSLEEEIGKTIFFKESIEFKEFESFEMAEEETTVTLVDAEDNEKTITIP